MEAVQFYFVFVYFFFMASAQNFARAALLFLFFVSFCGVLVVFVTWVRACSPIGAFRDQHARSHARTRPQRGEGDCVLSAASTSCWRHLQPSPLQPPPPPRFRTLSHSPSLSATLCHSKHPHSRASSAPREELEFEITRSRQKRKRNKKRAIKQG